MKKTRKDLVYEVLTEHSRGLHVRDIAKTLIDQGLERGITEDDLMAKISSALSLDLSKNKTKSRFRRVPNNKGGYKQGFYKNKREKKTHTDAAVAEMSDAGHSSNRLSSLYTGKAGEYAVLSELLFNGFNASLMSVDQGIDIVASKNDNFFYIQVKTANLRNGSFVATISRKQFEKFRTGRTFYVLVLRYSVDKKTRSNFIVLRSSDIERFMEIGVINKGDSFSLSIKVDKNRLILNNREENMHVYLNKFTSIE